MTTTTTLNTITTEAVERDTGLTARVIGTWTVAGGVFMGGFLVAAMTLAGRLNANGVLLTAAGLFVVGALLGCAGGALLGFLGRPAGVSAGEAAGRIGFAALLTVPALAVGFMAAAWLSSVTLAVYLGRPLPLVGVVIGALAGVVFLVAAAVEGWVALHNAARRGPAVAAAAAMPLVLLAATLVLAA